MCSIEPCVNNRWTDEKDVGLKADKKNVGCKVALAQVPVPLDEGSFKT